MALRSPLTVQPYDYIGDSTGRPLDKGQIYIGVAGQDPEFYQIPVFLDAEMTKPIDQPIRTNDGFVDFAGSLSELYASAEIYSVKVLDKQGRKVIYKAEMMRNNLTDDALQSLDDAITEFQAQAVSSTTQAVKDALNSAAIDNNTQVDTLITATPQGVGMVARTQAQVNAETVSLLDFGAPYTTDSTTHLQKAIDYLDSRGGGVLRIPYHTGTLVLSQIVTLKPNITILCDNNLIIDCTAWAGGSQFVLLGTTEAEIPISVNKTSGDTLIQLQQNHGYVSGDDVLIVSQRGCAHEDAGELWRLGEVTSSVNSPYFAEPLVVDVVETTKNFTSAERLIFPDYRKDKTRETMPTARDSATVMKMNLAKNFKWLGGTFKKNKGTLFNLRWTKDTEIDIRVIRGYGEGSEVYNIYSLRNDIKVKVTRPIDFKIIRDHSAFNSVKDISSWYTYVDLDEENGSQGLDQSYILYCGIYPRYKVRHVNSKEDALTTHGCTYGCVVDVYSINARKAVFRNRARFTTATIKGVNNQWGLVASTWGGLDSRFEFDLISNNAMGIYLLDEGVTAITPAVKNTSFTGYISMRPTSARRAVDIGENLDTANLLKDSNLSFNNLTIVSHYGGIILNKNVHGAVFNNVNIEYWGTGSPILLDTSTGNRFNNLTVTYKTTSGTRFAVESINTITRDPSYGLTGNHFDYDSCKTVNCFLTNASTESPIVTRNFVGTSSAQDLMTINSGNMRTFYTANLLSGNTGENRIILDNSIPIGFETQVLIITSVVDTKISIFGIGATINTVTFANGLVAPSNSIAGVVGSPKLVSIRKVADGNFIVYS